MRHDLSNNGICRVCFRDRQDAGQFCPGRPLTPTERASVEQWYPACWWKSGKVKKQHADFEDDAQEAAVQMCQSARTFNPAISNISTHLCNGAHWRLITVHRKRLTNGFSGLGHLVHSGEQLPSAALVEIDEEKCGAAPDDGPERAELADSIKDALRWLDKRVQYVVIERIWGCRTLKDIGDELGITRERVRQIFEEGVSKLRPLLRGIAAAHGFGKGVA
jgi:RNA polymerase sigma factor (sigma-70 family)